MFQWTGFRYRRAYVSGVLKGRMKVRIRAEKVDEQTVYTVYIFKLESVGIIQFEERVASREPSDKFKDLILHQKLEGQRRAKGSRKMEKPFK